MWISRQLIREYLATLARPRTGIAVADLTIAVRLFVQRFHVADETTVVTEHLLTLLNNGASTQIHDTNIVATMQTIGVKQLLTNNPADFAPFAALITVIRLNTLSSI